MQITIKLRQETIQKLTKIGKEEVQNKGKQRRPRQENRLL